MTIEQALYTYLTGVAGVTAVVGTRLYPVAAPQQESTPASWPTFAVYARTGVTRERAGGGPTGAVTVLFSITCWAATYPDAAAAGKAVRDALDGAKGTWSGLTISRVEADDPRDDFDATLQLFGRVVTTQIQYQEA